MTKLKKPAGAYLIGVAVVVAAFFITNPLLDPAKVWAVLDILMLIGLLTALAFNYAEAISLLRFEHHHEGRTGIIAKASRNC